ncbi:uncharacterized protein LOC143305852 [Osmia lignaria lignaria]|uniref:uncharacterized protein LOC143305852 n=1 Tax=Osmia lignaria lignaria TaxID=1437193 RepID=UPI00402B0CCC
MGAIVELLLFTTVLCTSVGGVQGECRHVMNDDMIEYTCEGGRLSDLNDLPESTGKIRITNMPISRITTNTFSRFGPDLWVLSCSQCQIRDIDPGAFQRLNNLQQLSLDNNYLTTVRESWFSGLDYLTYLDLNYNYIESIEDGVYRNLPSLIDLRLSGNRLECLNLEAMTNLRDLKRIFLGENSEFKCPNAVSAFLERRGVVFDRDPEWSKIPNDLIPAIPFGYDIDEYTTPEQTMALPTHRQRLHPTSATPPPQPMESTATYVPPKFHTTEEVIYRPVYTPDWRTTPRPTTEVYEEREHFSTPSPYYDDVARPYVPPRTIAPIDTYETTKYETQDATTLRSWPTFPESTSARPEYPLYPPHENKDSDYDEQYYSSEATNSFPLAPSPPDRHETPPFVESDAERTTVPYTDWYDRNTVPSYPPIYNRPPEYRVPPTSESPPTHIVQPLPPMSPEMVQPASPDNTFQAPYYEHTITVHTPPLVANQPSLEEVTPVMIPIETTTDKPLPNCPTSNLSSSSQGSLGTILVSFLLITIGRILVEGF